MNVPLDKKILEYINMMNSVTINEICNKFSVSQSTARRILVRLENRSEIMRFHGGANSVSKDDRSLILQERLDLNSREKERIAKRAADFVESNSTVILLGGTTVFKMCKYIKSKKLTVITSSILVFDSLKNSQNIELILLGGDYNKEEEELTGVLTITTSKLLTADYLFMSSSGYVEKVGFTTDDPSSVELYSWCLSVSRNKYILLDSSKLNYKGKAVAARIDNVTGVIIDGLSRNYRNAFHGKEVIVNS